MSLNLDPYKPANAETPISAAKMRNAFDAIVSHVNALPPANIEGYPGDGSVYLNGAGAFTSPGTGPIVTSLPGGPVDNQVCVYEADSTNRIYWQLQYQQSNNIWLKLGGPPLHVQVDASEPCTSTTYEDLATEGPKLTIPLASVGFCQFGVHFGGSGGTVVATAGLYVGTGPTDDDILSIQNQSNFEGNYMTTRKITATVGMVLKLQYKLSATGSRDFDHRWLTFDPIYVS